LVGLDSRYDRIRNGKRVEVTLIVEKMAETRLRWFRHVERRLVDSLVKRVDQMEGNQTTRERGRPRKTIKKDLEINELFRNIVYDRTLWRRLIHVADPTYWDKAWSLLLLLLDFCVHN
jgi:hypothetical protein